MSAWGDYTAGLIPDCEYNNICKQETYEAEYYAQHGHYPDEEPEEDED